MITDEGYLNNPYRSYRYRQSDRRASVRARTEIYPRTRTSNADRSEREATSCLIGRPCTAAIGSSRIPGASARTRSSSATRIRSVRRGFWKRGIASTPRNNADFYSDLFDRPDQQNFLARDKELSTFNSQTLRIGATYEFARNGWRFVKKGSLNIFYDRIEFDYEDFRDATFSLLPSSDPNCRPAGAEPLYRFGANVFRRSSRSGSATANRPAAHRIMAGPKLDRHAPLVCRREDGYEGARSA